MYFYITRSTPADVHLSWSVCSKYSKNFATCRESLCTVLYIKQYQWKRESWKRDGAAEGRGVENK